MHVSAQGEKVCGGLASNEPESLFCQMDDGVQPHQLWTATIYGESDCVLQTLFNCCRMLPYAIHPYEGCGRDLIIVKRCTA